MLHEIWGRARKPLHYREWVGDPGTGTVQWFDVPDLAGPSMVKPEDHQEPHYAADTLALCYSCGREYRYDMLAHPGPLMCPHCGAASTYERSRRLLNERHGLSL